MKKMITGFVAGALLFGGVGAYAASGGSTIQVFHNIKDIKINNVSSMPEQPPFTYEGTTFVPLRYISEELGLDVEWERENQTIHIADGPAEVVHAVYPGKGINYMNYQGSDVLGWGKDGFKQEFNTVANQRVKDVAGTEYRNYITMEMVRASESQITRNEALLETLLEYPLLKQYSTFKATVGLTEEYKTATTEVGLTIVADNDRKLYETTIKAGAFPEEIELDITNVNKISFVMTTDRKEQVKIGLFDAKFVK